MTPLITKTKTFIYFSVHTLYPKTPTEHLFVIMTGLRSLEWIPRQLRKFLKEVQAKTGMNDVGHDHVVRALSIKECDVAMRR